jgi:ABC-type antimicrobial peptide transport system permease subunit
MPGGLYGMQQLLLKPVLSFQRSKYMIKNYLKVAWRNLGKNKANSFINILGLATGMAVVMLIGLWMHDELSANKHHKNYASLYQVMMNMTFGGHRTTQPNLPFPLGEELKTRFPDLKGTAMCDFGGKHSLIYNEKKISRDGHFIGGDAVAMFSLDILKGDKDPLHDPYSMVLTDETASILFGTEDPIGKTVKMDNATNLKVTAVVRKQPRNSTFTFDYLAPWQLQALIYPHFSEDNSTNWYNNDWQLFVQLNGNAQPDLVNAKIKKVVLSHFTDENTLKNMVPEIFLHPMAKWRLYSEFENGVNTGGFIKYVRMFGILGIIILIIACINFMNLSTARSEKRAREVGVRKAVGSGRGQLISQFLSESMLIAVLSLVLAVGLVLMALPFFNRLTDKDMSLPVTSPVFWGMLILFTALTGVLAGSYPAFYLSSFNPVHVLKGNLRAGKDGSSLRKILVVLQFASAVVLMIGTLVVYKQIQLGKDRPIGWNNKGLVTVNLSNDIQKNFETIRQELISSGAVISVCKSSSPPERIYSTNSGWEWPNSQPLDKTIGFRTIATSYDYTKTLGIRLVAGRDFSRDFGDSNSVLLNQTAVKRMGLKEPVGTPLKWNGHDMVVVGVVPDIQMESPFRAVSPLTIVFSKYWASYMDLRINPSWPASKAIGLIKPIFDKYNPAYPFEYRFADEQYAKKFNYEELVGHLAAIIALLAVFISCLGLFALASFTAEQRIKEIGVRKVLGASVQSLWGLLSLDFVKLVLIACGIAVPTAWYAMNQWLKQYDYKIDISVGDVFLVVLLSIIITLSTVSYQAIKAATANPLKNLRTE